MARIFVSQELVDLWSTDERIALDGDVMVLAATGQRLQLHPAVRVLRVVSDTNDPHNLVGCVKAPAELLAIGGEQYMNSLLVGEAAYDVEPGWMGTPMGPSTKPDEEILAALALGAKT